MGFIGFLFNPKICQPAFSGTKDENNQQESWAKTLLVSILPPSSWSFRQSDSPDAGWTHPGLKNSDFQIRFFKWLINQPPPANVSVIFRDPQGHGTPYLYYSILFPNPTPIRIPKDIGMVREWYGNSMGSLQGGPTIGSPWNHP